MSSLKATVVVPTTGDRGALLPYSIGSIQNQTVENIEIFIIGDGVSDNTRNVIEQLQSEDSRIKFFDHPKHERRGEVYRHAAIQEAKGEIICYLCDRDLMLPNHVETLYSLLGNYNFAYTAFIRVRRDHSVMWDHYPKYFGPASENDKDLVYQANISLSNVGHTLDFYHKLPHGWRTTPEDQYTDVYMWKQLLAHPECNAYSHFEATVLYFKRGNFPGAPVSEREKDLEFWFEKISTEEGIEQKKKEAVKGLLDDRLQFRLQQMSNPLISVKGYDLTEVPSRIFQKFSKLLSK
ncbi:MAG: glycosyltransferase family 2 protein [Balneolaceae bacterium]|nr:glycosyltransferase family 2 protein [Balneolaceae bacterium]